MIYFLKLRVGEISENDSKGIIEQKSFVYPSVKGKEGIRETILSHTLLHETRWVSEIKNPSHTLT